MSSWSAACTRAAPAPRWRALAPTASSSEPAACKVRSTSRVRRLAAASSRLLASHTVQVMTDAKARPIITAFTTQSACMNMPQGDRSRGSIAFSAASKPSGSASGSAAGSIVPSAWTGTAPSTGVASVGAVSVVAGASAAGASADCPQAATGAIANAAIQSALRNGAQRSARMEQSRSADQCSRHRCSGRSQLRVQDGMAPENRRPAFAPVLAYMRMPRNINKSSGIRPLAQRGKPLAERLRHDGQSRWRRSDGQAWRPAADPRRAGSPPGTRR